jgi:hypothetical protein
LLCSFLGSPEACHKGQSKTSSITQIAETTSIYTSYKQAWYDGVIRGECVPLWVDRNSAIGEGNADNR